MRRSSKSWQIGMIVSIESDHATNVLSSRCKIHRKVSYLARANTSLRCGRGNRKALSSAIMATLAPNVDWQYRAAQGPDAVEDPGVLRWARESPVRQFRARHAPRSTRHSNARDSDSMQPST